MSGKYQKPYGIDETDSETGHGGPEDSGVGTVQIYCKIVRNNASTISLTDAADIGYYSIDCAKSRIFATARYIFCLLYTKYRFCKVLRYICNHSSKEVRAWQSIVLC